MKMPNLKQLFSLCLLGGGIALSAFSVWLVLIVWKGGWDVTNQPQQLEILGWALLGGLSGVAVTLISIAVGGPLRALKGEAGPVKVEVDGD